MLKDLKTTMLKDLKVGIDKRFKSMMKKKKAKPDNSNDENAEPAPPKKRTKASDVPLSIMSLPPQETATVSVSSDFAMCSPMSGRRTLRMTPHPSAVPRSWWVRDDISPSQEAMVIRRQHAMIGTSRYMSPVFGQRNRNYSR